jgi:hypothetical protein
VIVLIDVAPITLRLAVEVVSLASVVAKLSGAALIGSGLWLHWERPAKERAQEQLDRLDQERRDQEFAARLDAIHMSRVAVVNGRYSRGPNQARADRQYEAAFREAGIGEVLDDPAIVAERVRASNIRARPSSAPRRLTPSGPCASRPWTSAPT